LNEGAPLPDSDADHDVIISIIFDQHPECIRWWEI